MSRVGLLVSVRDAQEALAALEGGADIIDVKEPTRGALGRADAATIAAIIAAVGGRRPISAALGELVESEEAGIGHQRLPIEIQFAKMGLAGAASDWAQRLTGYFAGVPGIRPIAVAYADCRRAKSPMVDEVLAWAIGHHATGLLIDTFGKDGGSLLDWMDGDRLRAVIARCREAGLTIALAGSLRGESLRRAASLEPDIVAVRGAACAGQDRQGEVKAENVRSLATALAGQEGEIAGRLVRAGSPRENMMKSQSRTL